MKNWLSVTPPHSPFFHLIPHACFDNLDWIFFLARFGGVGKKSQDQLIAQTKAAVK